MAGLQPLSANNVRLQSAILVKNAVPMTPAAPQGTSKHDILTATKPIEPQPVSNKLVEPQSVSEVLIGKTKKVKVLLLKVSMLEMFGRILLFPITKLTRT